MTESRNEVLSRSATLFFLACFLLICFLMYLIFRPFLSILIWACVLAVVFQPLFGSVLRRTRGRRGLAALVSCILILVLFVVPVTVLAVMIGQQSVALYHSMQADTAMSGDAAARIQALQNHAWIRWITGLAARYLGPEAVDFQKLLKESLSAASRFAVELAPSLLMSVGDVIYRFLIIFITMMILFSEGPKILNTLRSSNPLPASVESEFIRNFEDVSYATFYGSILGAVMLGVISAFLYWILGIASPLFWGAAVSFVALIPVIGALLIWLPMPVYLIITGYTTKGIVLLVIGGVAVFLVDNVVKPVIIGGRSDMHPLLIFFAVLGGLEAFGFLGLLLGPLVVTIFLTFLRLFRSDYRTAGAMDGAR